ncbi:hypothetical protein [Rhodococcus sp. JVH1]|uniref:hypothetical protein n=1 Tax=Rhodococcus sp. JVH1 TaxID=745408 RepID=UPI000271E989|nr:hypothetical protein [Rhodococcus sp. JVH1]EJJ01780.1 hypothetical protein JVH1_0700 [Rhodococcus sp. JVH1]
MTGNAATTPPLGEILTADEIAQFVYSTRPVVLVDVEPALAAPARAYGDWRGALGLPDLAGKVRTLVPETAGGRAAVALIPAGPGAQRPPRFGSGAWRSESAGYDIAVADHSQWTRTP